MITPDLCRGARNVLNLSSQQWADRCGISRITLHRYENGGAGSDDLVRTLTETFEAHGIHFSRRGTMESIKRQTLKRAKDAAPQDKPLDLEEDDV